MAFACLILILLCFPLGLAAVALYLTGSIVLTSEWFGISFEGFQAINSVLFIAAVPACGGIGIVLVERLCEVRGALTSFRMAVSLGAVTLLASQDAWIEYLSQLLVLPGSRPLLAQGALTLALLNSVVFCATLSALALVSTQFLVQVGVEFGLRMSRVKAKLPWPALRLLGAILILTFFAQQVASFVAYELAPRAVVRQMR